MFNVTSSSFIRVEFYKIFPGDLIGGPAFVKAVKGPLRRDAYEDVNR
jgi:2-keto-3-deoxy-6-phosphogluconate aldolase